MSWRSAPVGATIDEVTILPPGGAIVVRDLTHRGFVATLAAGLAATWDWFVGGVGEDAPAGEGRG